MHRLCFR